MKKSLKAGHEMSIQEQLNLMKEWIPNFKNKDFYALSNYGVVWIDKENNMTYFIKDNENIIILNTEESY